MQDRSKTRVDMRHQQKQGMTCQDGLGALPAWQGLPSGVHRLGAKPAPEADQGDAPYEEGRDGSHQSNAQLIGLQDLVYLQHSTLSVHLQLLHLYAVATALRLSGH